MNDLKLKKLCPLPWLHFSAHLDATMRICCNTDGPGFVLDNSGQTIKISDVSSVSDYFNLEYFKTIRSKMLRGEEPQECSKCYEVEKYRGQSVRQGYLSLYQNDETFLASVKKTNPISGEIDPTVQSLDFSLSNKCNLKCIMCSPGASYIIKNDYDKLNLDYPKEFAEGAHRNWKNLDKIENVISQIIPTLNEFLITGGEPFLSDEHIQILDLIVKEGRASHVNLSYHTNCTVKDDRLLKLWENFKSVSLRLSIDAHGPLNEYIRYQTNWKDVSENVKTFTSLSNVYCEVHTTVQALNVLHLTELYEWIRTLNNVLPMPFHIWMDNPEWLRMDILPPDVLQTALERIDRYFRTHSTTDSLVLNRRQQICSYIKRAMETHQGEKGLQDFKSRIRQFEGIRRTPKIEELVPELRSLFS